MSRPHYHPDERYIIVLRAPGTRTKERFRPSQTVPLKPGDFMRHPAGGPHYDGALHEDTWVAIGGYGPTKATVIDGGELFGSRDKGEHMNRRIPDVGGGGHGRGTAAAHVRGGGAAAGQDHAHSLLRGAECDAAADPLLQSNMVVIIETDANITGIGEGGTRDTLEPCAGRLIGKNPFHIERLWQDMYRAFHYPPGRERLHAIGALDLALWDLKGKALGVPVYELLGGLNRNYLECYTTTFRGGGNTLRDRAAACMQAGWRLFRFDAASVRGTSTCDARERMRQVQADCRDAREGVGPAGNFMVDFHQRFTLTDAVRGCKMIEEFDPYLVEDPSRPIRSCRTSPSCAR